MKRQGDEMVVGEIKSWQNDKLMNEQVDERTSWWNGKLTKWQVDKMTNWQNDKLTKGKLMKWPSVIRTCVQRKKPMQAWFIGTTK